MEKKTLYRYFEGIASREEEEAVYHWLDTTPANEKELLREREFFDAMILAGSAEDVKGKEEGEQKRKRKRSGFRIHSFAREMLKVAAVVVITVACGLYFHLADKKELLSVMNTISVPIGQRVNLKLPDGTLVWLNACSEIVYPAVFSSGKREVRLNGEAYFEVTHNVENPFVVRTEKCDIEVLGTKFNVEAYAGSGDFSTALMEGSVKVTGNGKSSRSVLLKPDQEVRLKGGRLAVSSISDYDHFRWREGLVCFKDVAFNELMTRFEKCYGIQIIVENKHLKEYTCSGKFRISDGVDNALRILQRDARYTFERNEDNSIIYIK
ncbi:FecR family protein [Parabacteroides sp. BX2]|jgi:transmembrane sensor|uniref:FecR family protein n=1 Tax=Parabacteroides segnis TaxID=2763058 RepID=A0ABR7E693_9BACT|nr:MULTISPECIES: FecR family protein [Parabacteroides]MBC5644574.1 FecR family protein [Parabacteroides segnis]MCM0714619.1 FecR domain-containing protein [Parabacteroides sp. TA-V-105]